MGPSPSTWAGSKPGMRASQFIWVDPSCAHRRLNDRRSSSAYPIERLTSVSRALASATAEAAFANSASTSAIRGKIDPEAVLVVGRRAAMRMGGVNEHVFRGHVALRADHPRIRATLSRSSMQRSTAARPP